MSIVGDAVPNPPSAPAIVSWRRAVAALYARVRAVAATSPPDAHGLWSGERDRLFRDHPASPLPASERQAFSGLPVGSYDPAYRFTVAMDTQSAPERLEIPTGSDGVIPFVQAGSATLGDLGTVDVWWLDSYGGGLFLPLKDGLAGRGTYAGGRYVLDTVKGADLGGDGDHLVVDLNFAYNPSCAYAPEWTCPLPPSSNTLTAQVPVGELVEAPRK